MYFQESVVILTGADIGSPANFSFGLIESSKTIRVPIINDNVNEEKEVFVLQLNAFGQPQVDISQREISYCEITDNDGE